MNVTVDLWARNRDLATTWCAVRSVSDGSYLSFCNGRWNVGDVEQFDVCANPPADKRCAACERVIDAERVANGLRELADRAPLVDATTPDSRFDGSDE